MACLLKIWGSIMSRVDDPIGDFDKHLDLLDKNAVLEPYKLSNILPLIDNHEYKRLLVKFLSINFYQCDNCGKYFNDMNNLNDDLLCDDCRAGREEENEH